MRSLTEQSAKKWSEDWNLGRTARASRRIRGSTTAKPRRSAFLFSRVLACSGGLPDLMGTFGRGWGSLVNLWRSASFTRSVDQLTQGSCGKRLLDIQFHLYSMLCLSQASGDVQRSRSLVSHYSTPLKESPFLPISSYIMTLFPSFCKINPSELFSDGGARSRRFVKTEKRAR